jgi:exopolyphosphatase/guanosine-5'-triphosphate,3'-diphosphate pyrophosphatase
MLASSFCGPVGGGRLTEYSEWLEWYRLCRLNISARSEPEVRRMEEIFATCISLGRDYDFEEEHSRQDARLAVRIFDLTTGLHHLDDEYRDLLYCAGLLHDIGYVEGYWGHHKTAYRLIMKSDLSGLTLREKRIVANVARYHRGAKPKLSHKGFAALDSDDREVVTMLAAILRLADGLDRGHTDAVRDLDVWLEGKRLVIEVDCPFGCSAEIWAGEKKGRFFGQVFGVEVEVQQRLGT